MKLSVIIPFYYGKPDKVKMLHDCIESLGDEPDEILVIGNTHAGLPWSLNKGLKAASGEFLMILSDDMVKISGNLLDLCHDNLVTHPLVNGTPSIFGGAMCLPRAVYEDVGEYDENFLQGYYDDDDMIKRIENAGYERRMVETVNMYHPDPGNTLGSLVNQAIMAANKSYFERKWGEWKPVSTPTSLT